MGSSTLRSLQLGDLLVELGDLGLQVLDISFIVGKESGVRNWLFGIGLRVHLILFELSLQFFDLILLLKELGVESIHKLLVLISP